MIKKKKKKILGNILFLCAGGILRRYYIHCKHLIMPFEYEKYYFYNIFITNSKWQILISGKKKVILVINSNYNQ